MTNQIDDNFKRIWGAHFHMDVSEKDLGKAIIIHRAFQEYLKSQNIFPSHDSVFKPGYGPHILHQWEVRLEKSPPEQVLESIGIGATWLAMNRHNLTAIVHPLTHNENRLDLETEAEDHRRLLWMGTKPPLNLDFFYNPPMTKDGKIKDTRTPNLLSVAEQNKIVEQQQKANEELRFIDPKKTLINGFHIHVDFTAAQKRNALAVYERFLNFLNKTKLPYTSTSLYAPNKNGPHIMEGWEVKFEIPNANVMAIVGRAFGWLMLNRSDLSVYIHPVTWKEGEVQAEIEAHEKYAMFMGDKTPLNVDFFVKNAEKSKIRNAILIGIILVLGIATLKKLFIK